MGTPTHAFDKQGAKVWERKLHIYGAVRKEIGIKGLVPQLYQGQMMDAETGLAYNRFRYYDNESGNYISQDPIGLAGGINFYAYVHNVNGWVDVFGWHGNSLDNVANSILYDIKINGTQFKYGIANANVGRVTKTDISVIRPNGSTTIIPAGTPTRLKDQLRKAYSNYDDVGVKTTAFDNISTADMKGIENKAIGDYLDLNGKVPSGNAGHSHLGPLADDFNGVHDLKKDLSMQNNKAKTHH